MNKLIIKNLQEAFHKLGIALTPSESFYEFKYEHILMLLSIDAADHSFAFVSPVVDSSDGCLNEVVLNTAIDVVEGFHKDFCGDWNEGKPYFVSPDYYLEGDKEVSTEWLQKRLKAFVDAYLFLEVNIHLLCDSDSMYNK